MPASGLVTSSRSMPRRSRFAKESSSRCSGPNGAGKTTLIRAIAGRVRLDRGEIRLFGKPIDGRRPPPELGIVPQELAVYPLLTARENLEAFGRLQGLSRSDIAGQVRWALAVTGLAERADEPVKGFSGGMKRRLNIACGVLQRPRVVLLDEPTWASIPRAASASTTCSARSRRQAYRCC
jgi:ABC-2 type transport system ATP-binding protein